MKDNSFLLYGANGYTGRLILKLASDYNLYPVLAGRNESALVQLSKEFNRDYFVLDLSETEKLESVLKKFPLVLHCAGPFINTAQQMIKACLKTGTHYIDITGEIVVFELAKKFNDVAIKSNIMLMPGVGFDVVPTDCLALFLKNKLPDATKLKLAFASIGGGLSHGTATTMVGGLGGDGAERKNGKIIRVPLGQKSMWVDFGLKKLFVMSIPWGDISTSFTTTGIDNIETYTGTSPKIYYLLKFQKLFNWILRSKFIRRIVKNKIDKSLFGPSDKVRTKSKGLVWGEVKNANGKIFSARLIGPEGYTLTAHSSLIIAKKILAGTFKLGYQTPAGCYGEDLILEIPDVKREVI
ncbi:MAG: saccharopine dehydrogenase NADP-binding domain-containing protein [Bacteroidetes bacterium]|nr:saccharopine dehydrogenase NADP-binding domain-containing protein [Bacteroidota bacterium]